MRMSSWARIMTEANVFPRTTGMSMNNAAKDIHKHRVMNSRLV